MRNASSLRYLYMSHNKLFLLLGAQNIVRLFDLAACPSSLILPSFGNTTVIAVLELLLLLLLDEQRELCMEVGNICSIIG
jgi:hypothetical protein